MNRDAPPTEFAEKHGLRQGGDLSRLPQRGLSLTKRPMARCSAALSGESDCSTEGGKVNLMAGECS